jgi:hypothetical protein
VLEVGRGKDKPAFVLKAALSGMDLLARRGDEPHAVAFPASTAGLLTPQAARFRSLAVLALGDSNLRAIEIARGPVHERVVRAQGAPTWSLAAPQPLAADSVIVGELARALAALEAVRFEADSPSPPHGLSAPVAIVTLEHAEPGKGPQRAVIEIGAETEGGRFAQLRGSPGVFVLSTRSAKLVLEPLVSRSLLATPLEHLRSVTLEHAGKRAEITRGEGGFVPTAGTQLSADAARQLAQTVATLRATRVLEYGPPAADLQLQAPAAKLVVSADGDPAPVSYTLALGADAGQGARFARRSDVPVTFVLPKDSVDRLLSAAQ